MFLSPSFKALLSAFTRPKVRAKRGAGDPSFKLTAQQGWGGSWPSRWRPSLPTLATAMKQSPSDVSSRPGKAQESVARGRRQVSGDQCSLGNSLRDRGQSLNLAFLPWVRRGKRQLQSHNKDLLLTLRPFSKCRFYPQGWEVLFTGKPCERRLIDGGRASFLHDTDISEAPFLKAPRFTRGVLPLWVRLWDDRPEDACRKPMVLLAPWKKR